MLNNNTATYVIDVGPATRVIEHEITHEVAAPADLGISKSPIHLQLLREAHRSHSVHPKWQAGLA
ncbi:MAG: hypothetical protein IPG76_23080 [Acidobacteria bacterium]|nr:hypothetical protein [Acidobacteriota bacterium]